MSSQESGQLLIKIGTRPFTLSNFSQSSTILPNMIEIIK